MAFQDFFRRIPEFFRKPEEKAPQPNTPSSPIQVPNSPLKPNQPTPEQIEDIRSGKTPLFTSPPTSAPSTSPNTPSSNVTTGPSLSDKNKEVQNLVSGSVNNVTLNKQQFEELNRQGKLNPAFVQIESAKAVGGFEFKVPFKEPQPKDVEVVLTRSKALQQTDERLNRLSDDTKYTFKNFGERLAFTASALTSQLASPIRTTVNLFQGKSLAEQARLKEAEDTFQVQQGKNPYLLSLKQQTLGSEAGFLATNLLGGEAIAFGSKVPRLLLGGSQAVVDARTGLTLGQLARGFETGAKFTGVGAGVGFLGYEGFKGVQEIKQGDVAGGVSRIGVTAITGGIGAVEVFKGFSSGPKIAETSFLKLESKALIPKEGLEVGRSVDIFQSGKLVTGVKPSFEGPFAFSKPNVPNEFGNVFATSPKVSDVFLVGRALKFAQKGDTDSLFRLEASAEITGVGGKSKSLEFLGLGKTFKLQNTENSLVGSTSKFQVFESNKLPLFSDFSGTRVIRPDVFRVRGRGLSKNALEIEQLKSIDFLGTPKQTSSQSVALGVLSGKTSSGVRFKGTVKSNVFQETEIMTNTFGNNKGGLFNTKADLGDFLRLSEGKSLFTKKSSLSEAQSLAKSFSKASAKSILESVPKQRQQFTFGSTKVSTLGQRLGKTEKVTLGLSSLTGGSLFKGLISPSKTQTTSFQGSTFTFSGQGQTQDTFSFQTQTQDQRLRFDELTKTKQTFDSPFLGFGGGLFSLGGRFGSLSSSPKSTRSGKKFSFGKKTKSKKKRGQPKLLADIISVGQSQYAFGKATSPLKFKGFSQTQKLGLARVPTKEISKFGTGPIRQKALSFGLGNLLQGKSRRKRKK